MSPLEHFLAFGIHIVRCTFHGGPGDDWKMLQENADAWHLDKHWETTVEDFASASESLAHASENVWYIIYLAFIADRLHEFFDAVTGSCEWHPDFPPSAYYDFFTLFRYL
jgi:hypothetical protein